MGTQPRDGFDNGPVTTHTIAGREVRTLTSPTVVDGSTLAKMGYALTGAVPSLLLTKFEPARIGEETVYGKRSFCRDERDAMYSQGACLDYYNYLIKEGRDYGPIEIDQLQKSSVLSGRGPYAYAVTDRVGEKNKMDAATHFGNVFSVLNNWARSWCASLQQDDPRLLKAKKVWGGNSGYPLYVPGNHPLNDFAHGFNLTIAGWNSWSRANGRAETVDGSTWIDRLLHERMLARGLCDNFPFMSYLMHYRIQPGGHKFIPVIAATANGYRVDVEVRGDSARFRDVNGPGYESEEFRISAALMRLAFESTRFLHHKKPGYSPAPWLLTGKPVSLDLSSADDHVNSTWLEAFATFAEPFLLKANIGLTRDALLAHLRRPFLGGPQGGGHLLFVLEREGKNPSGSPFTFAINTFCNVAVALRAAELQGLDLVAFFEGTDPLRSVWEHSIYSDDAQAIVPSYLEPILDQAYADSGFKFTRVDGYVLLMRARDPAFAGPTNLVSRCIQNTADGERRSPGPATEVVGILARWIKAVNHCDRVFFERYLLDSPAWPDFCKKLGLPPKSTVESLFGLASTVAFSKRFAKEVGSDPMYSRSLWQDMSRGTFESSDDLFTAAMLGKAGQTLGDFASVWDSRRSSRKPPSVAEVTRYIDNALELVSASVWSGVSSAYGRSDPTLSVKRDARLRSLVSSCNELSALKVDANLSRVV